MRILHIASFDGNIGDNASHIGFGNLMTSIGLDNAQIDRLEIRKFYNNYKLTDKQYFDANFATLANKYDLLLIGGGGFLDFDIANSQTGTTVNISNEVLDSIKVPVYILSIGANPRNEIPEGNVQKFTSFLDAFYSNGKNFIGVRNDGSKATLQKYIGNKITDAIPEVLDHGFFYTNDGSSYLPTEKPYILINTTQDQMKMANVSKLPAGFYESEMNRVVNHILLETDLDIVFAPHIYSDLDAISDLVKPLNDFYVRNRIGLTPYAQGDRGCNQIFSAYKNSALSIGMRFHANVCSIAMGNNCLGIAALNRVKEVFESVDMPDNVVNIQDGFGDVLISKITETIQAGKKEVGVNEVLKQKRAESIKIYKDIFNSLPV